MDAEAFVEAIKKYVRRPAVDDTLSNLRSPPGRKVSANQKLRAEWYNSLSDLDAKMVREVVQEAVDETVFGFFSVLGGSRVISDGRFELFYVEESNSIRVLLNDPNGIGLNEIFTAVD